jgi:uncharacterized protein YbaA (DUF1428 family)
VFEPKEDTMSKSNYVDCFALAVPKKNLEKYREMAELAGKVWREHGAISYTEAVADDVQPGKLTSFPQAVQQKDDEVVVVAWVEYESREQRDRCVEKVMKDSRMNMDPASLPFDGARMFWGGFKPIVQV